jgi:hypothetical protein
MEIVQRAINNKRGVIGCILRLLVPLGGRTINKSAVSGCKDNKKGLNLQGIRVSDYLHTDPPGVDFAGYELASFHLRIPVHRQKLLPGQWL